MPKLVIEEAHALTGDEAKKRVEALHKSLADKLAFALSWRSDTEAKLERTGALGSIKIEPQRILVNLDLSFALSPLKGKIEGWIRDGLRGAEPPAGPRQEPPCGCKYDGSRRVTQCDAHRALDARLADPVVLHERGGPLPTLLPAASFHPRLAQVIQEARGRLHAGAEPMDIGAYLAEMAYCLPPAVPSLLAGPGFSQEDLQVAVAYLLKAMESKARGDLIQEQKAAKATQEKAK